MYRIITRILPVLFFLLIAKVNIAQVVIGAATPDGTAMLDVVSSSKGFLPPRMTTIQRDAIVSPASGLTIFNTTTKAFECFNGTAWYSTVHYIGESYGGGIVFYVYDNGQHGLITDIKDKTSSEWFNGASKLCNVSKDGINGGISNTDRIIIIQGAGNYAAQSCANNNAGNYADWYLPSKYELNLLYLHRSVVGGFSSNYYFSSTEFDTYNVWCQNFKNGIQNTDGKYNTYGIRPIRAF
jgi:hypothetical protein